MRSGPTAAPCASSGTTSNGVKSGAPSPRLAQAAEPQPRHGRHQSLQCCYSVDAADSMQGHAVPANAIRRGVPSPALGCSLVPEPVLLAPVRRWSLPLSRWSATWTSSPVSSRARRAWTSRRLPRCRHHGLLRNHHALYETRRGSVPCRVAPRPTSAAQANRPVKFGHLSPAPCRATPTTHLNRVEVGATNVLHREVQPALDHAH